MQTIILRNRFREGSSSKTWSIEVLGESACKEALKQSIGELEYHPAKAARRSLIDMLTLIEEYGFQIRHTEHNDDQKSETWLFLLQR